MTVFKPGDRVRCIEDDGGEDNDPARYLTDGAVYAVIDTRNDLVWVGTMYDGWSPRRFELAEKPPVSFKAGDRVRVVKPMAGGPSVGSICTVTEVYGAMRVNLEGSPGGWHSSRFELVTESGPAVSVGTYDQRVQAFELAALMTDPRNDSYRYSPSEVLGFLLGDKTL